VGRQRADNHASDLYVTFRYTPADCFVLALGVPGSLALITFGFKLFLESVNAHPIPAVVTLIVVGGAVFAFPLMLRLVRDLLLRVEVHDEFLRLRRGVEFNDIPWDDVGRVKNRRFPGVLSVWHRSGAPLFHVANAGTGFAGLETVFEPEGKRTSNGQIEQAPERSAPIVEAALRPLLVIRNVTPPWLRPTLYAAYLAVSTIAISLLQAAIDQALDRSRDFLFDWSAVPMIFGPLAAATLVYGVLRHTFRINLLFASVLASATFWYSLVTASDWIGQRRLTMSIKDLLASLAVSMVSGTIITLFIRSARRGSD
jgi:hypothetical protein